MDVYLDLVMLLNFSVDFLLLWATAWLTAYPSNMWRIVVAAGLGGFYAGVCLLPGLTFLAGPIWHLMCLVAMTCITFGCHLTTVYQGGVFVFLSSALGGLAHIIGKGGGWAVVMATGVLLGFCFLGFRKELVKKEYASIRISYKSKTLYLTALMDTGNTLLDPVTGHRVLVVDSRVARTLLDLSEEELMHPIETISRGTYPGLRLIPYCAVGQPSGMLLGLRVDGLRINGTPSNQIVAFAPQKIGQGNGYEALLGGCK